MSDDLFAEPSWNNWRRSLQRLAAWMTRSNRNPEPNRLPDEARVDMASASRCRRASPCRHDRDRCARKLVRRRYGDVYKQKLVEGDDPVVLARRMAATLVAWQWIGPAAALSPLPMVAVYFFSMITGWWGDQAKGGAESTESAFALVGTTRSIRCCRFDS